MAVEDDVNSSDNNSKPKTVVGSSSDLNLSFGDPLYLHPNDTSGTLIFPMGLDESYLAIRSDLLTREPLPSVKAAFSVISGEESHRDVTSVRPLNLLQLVLGPNPNLKCTDCNKTGHTVDRCFELVGYPAGYVKRNFNSNYNVHSNGVSSNNATTGNSHVSLSSE
ncbi:hypothetical protein Tco_1168884 [Tanacetum coccineum]